ncbi:MAG TPA: HD domain-containing phosphohydrolase [Ilumatobacteraceae bacterium]|nr:HD domain-containing phosphohydrolase [Ilumatobacteraceae bacterium]
MQEPAVAAHERDHQRVRSLIDEAARCRSADPERSRQLALAARVLARTHSRPDLEAEALYHLASIAHQRGRSEYAFALATEAVELAPENEVSLTLAWSLHLLGVVHYQASNYPDALGHCLRALQVYRATDHGVDEGRILHTVAAIYQSMADYDRAVATYETALAVNEPLARADVDAMVLGNLARIRGRRGEYAEAIELGRRAALIAQSDAPHLVGSLLADLAEAYVGMGELDAADACFEEARAGWAARSRSGEELPAAEKLGVMVSEGRVALRTGRVDEAIAALLAALDLADRTDHRELELELHDLLAEACKQAGRLSEALEHRERHFALHREIFSDAADLRMRTVQVAHDNENARRLGQITRLTTSGLVADFAAQHVDVDAYHLEAYERLAALAELRGGNTTRHTSGVGDLAAEIGHAIGQRPEWCERLRLAARLHDIGKVAINDRLLLKPGPLTVEEFDEIKQHTVLGRRLLSGVSTELFALAAEAAWSHHEWWDGSGYPNGLAGTSIPLSGRIVAIADVFDSLVTRRVYKREWTRDEAERFVVSGSGSQFDPGLVDAFVEVLVGRYPDVAAH